MPILFFVNNLMLYCIYVKRKTFNFCGQKLGSYEGAKVYLAKADIIFELQLIDFIAEQKVRRNLLRVRRGYRKCGVMPMYDITLDHLVTLDREVREPPVK